MATSPRSRWIWKETGGRPIFEQPRAEQFVSPEFVSTNDAQPGSPVNVIRYPVTVTEQPGSAYVRCYRTVERFDLCEKTYGCCTDGCCPKDEWWMAGVYVLIAFVVIVAVVAVIIGVVCYKRSSGQKRKERMYYSNSGSIVGSQPYGSEIGSHRSINMAAPY